MCEEEGAPFWRESPQRSRLPLSEAATGKCCRAGGTGVPPQAPHTPTGGATQGEVPFRAALQVPVAPHHLMLVSCPVLSSWATHHPPSEPTSAKVRRESDAHCPLSLPTALRPLKDVPSRHPPSRPYSISSPPWPPTRPAQVTSSPPTVAFPVPLLASIKQLQHQHDARPDFGLALTVFATR